MTPLSRSVMYTLGVLSKKSWPQTVPLLGFSLLVLEINPVITLAVFIGAALALLTGVILCAVSRGTPSGRDLTIHWGNTKRGLERTLDCGYSQSSWGSPLFGSKITKSVIPSLMLTSLKVLLALTYCMVGYGLLLLLEPANLTVLSESSNKGLLFVILVTLPALIAMKASFVILRRKYLIAQASWTTVIAACIALADRSAIFLDPQTLTARHCVQLNGNVSGMFKWTQHNSAEGDLY